MSVSNLVIAGVEAMARSNSGSVSVSALIVSTAMLCAVLIESLRPTHDAAERSSTAWPPPEGMYWGM